MKNYFFLATILLSFTNLSVQASEENKIQPKVFNKGLLTPLKNGSTLFDYFLANVFHGTEEQRSHFAETKVYKFMPPSKVSNGYSMVPVPQSYRFLGSLKDHAASGQKYNELKPWIVNNEALFCSDMIRKFDAEMNTHHLDAIIVGTKNLNHCAVLKQIQEDKIRRKYLANYLATNHKKRALL